jgi:hypothetical protein
MIEKWTHPYVKYTNTSNTEFLGAPRLTFLVLTKRADPVAVNTFDLAQPLFPQGANLSRELHLHDFRAVMGAVPIGCSSGQRGTI